MFSNVAIVVIACILSSILSALLTMIFIYIKGTRRDVDTQRKKLSDLKETLPLDYVRREDFVRWSISIDKKIDDLFNLIRGLKNSRETKTGGKP